MQATIREVADWCGSSAIARLSGHADGIQLTGVSTDSRRVAPGHLFVPIIGERVDGHDYLAAAYRSGAAAALWESDRPQPDDASQLPLILVEDVIGALQALAAGYLSHTQAKVVGVTGSNGKTTTKDLLAAVLGTGFRVHKTEGNYNNHIGMPLTILSAPERTELFVLEMGMSEFGEIELLSKLAKPDAAVITNIGESHLLQLGSRRNIARAKLEILSGMKPGGMLTYYGQEPLIAEELAAIADSAALAARGINFLTYGETDNCALVAGNIDVSAEGTSFTVQDAPGIRFELPIPGRHNAINALAAIAIGRRFGLTDAQIAQGLQSVKPTSMRIERSLASNGAVVLNDAYNASPTSVKAAIDLVAGLTGYRNKWIVLGDMLELGPDEAAFHAQIGVYLTMDKTDRVLLYGPLSSHTNDAAKRHFAADRVLYFNDKNALIDRLLAELAPEDLVLVKASRGMRMEEVVAALNGGERS
ncbi:UDP-N-acetylmuramoyl-tripeptide--D-alanyl-D-alanine ligase [Cohnella yongneupensis]|uniref:UDP-N-acetylmuramoyl-tripeptide--D-alanyl-D-alanine ligase n=1 Tax=Cohnella yongneupensis TaxID=425006 RepID=A0ABW0R9Y4_9BACL